MADIYLLPITASFWPQSGFQTWYILQYFRIVEYLMSYLPFIPMVTLFISNVLSQFHSIISLLSNKNIN